GRDEAVPAFEAVAALARTARLENPRLAYRVAGVPPDAFSGRMALLLRELNAGSDDDCAVQYDDDVRLVRRHLLLDAGAQSPGASPLRERGVYLITGGGGALGLRFAEHLAARARANVILIGRSAAGRRVRARLDALAH